MRYPLKEKHEEWILGDFSRQNCMAPSDIFTYHFYCRSCDVKWNSRSQVSRCFVCDKETTKR